VTGNLILYFTDSSLNNKVIILTHDNGEVFSGTVVNQTVTLGPFDLPNGNGASLNIGGVTLHGVLWIDKVNPVNGSASFAVDTFPSFKKPFPSVPTREEVLGIGMRFRGGIVVNSAEFGKMPWWPSALSWLNSNDRRLVYEQMRAAGDTHALIEIPNGLPLYNEGGQFYSPDKFSALDWTNNETALDSRFSDLVDEVIGEGFRFLIAMDERVDHSTKIVQLAMEALTDEQLSYGLTVPGYDGVFYGWSPTQITNWAKVARAIKPQAYLGLQFNPGHIPLGNGPNDYTYDGAMAGYDMISGTFNSWYSKNPGDDVLQILGRCIRPYNRPPYQVGDPNPPFYLIDSPRGKRSFCAFETSYPYYWVRVDMNNQTAIDTMIKDIDNETVTLKQLGCHFTG
jgi:hypothetical protein